MSRSKTGYIIFLNGTSSAGKTSIAKLLCPMISPACVVMGIDDFMRTVITHKAQELGCTIGTGKWHSWWEDLQIIKECLPGFDRFMMT